VLHKVVQEYRDAGHDRGLVVAEQLRVELLLARTQAPDLHGVARPAEHLLHYLQTNKSWVKTSSRVDTFCSSCKSTISVFKR
jgi:hypothetical protein